MPTAIPLGLPRRVGSIPFASDQQERAVADRSAASSSSVHSHDRFARAFSGGFILCIECGVQCVDRLPRAGHVERAAGNVALVTMCDESVAAEEERRQRKPHLSPTVSRS